MTDTLAQPAAQPRPRAPAPKPPAARLPRKDGRADPILRALTAIAHAIPSHLLAPWLPGTLVAVSRRHQPR